MSALALSTVTAASSTTELSLPTPEAALENSIKAALEHARRLSQMPNCNITDLALAWEKVEELRKARASRSDSCQSGFSRYVEENPHALECRIYDV